MVKLSIITACHNSNKSWLKAAIESVLLQTYSDFEYIIVDDGSTTPVEGLVKNITNDKRVTVYRIEHSGLGAALNYGISQSKGEYIARFDDDDLMCADRLEKQIAYLDRHDEVSCVGTMHYDMTDTHYRKHRKYPTEHKEIMGDMLRLKWAMAHTTLMFRRDSFDKMGGYRIAGGGQDVDLILQLGLVGKLANLPEYLTYYRMTNTGLSVNNPAKYKAYLFAFESLRDTNALPDKIETIKASIQNLNKLIEEQGKKSYGRKLIVWRINILGKKLKS